MYDQTCLQTLLLLQCWAVLRTKKKKSCIREILNFPTCVDSSTNNKTDINRQNRPFNFFPRLVKILLFKPVRKKMPKRNQISRIKGVKTCKTHRKKIIKCMVFLVWFNTSQDVVQTQQNCVNDHDIQKLWDRKYFLGWGWEVQHFFGGEGEFKG